MKKRIRGLKWATFQLDFDLYRVKVPIRDYRDSFLSVIDLSPQGIEQTIVLQHGFAGVAESWEYQLTHFASQFRVVAPELRGHGQSDAPYSDYTMPELVGDLNDVINTLDLPDRVYTRRSFIWRSNLHRIRKHLSRAHRQTCSSRHCRRISPAQGGIATFSYSNSRLKTALALPSQMGCRISRA